eukprot:gene37170-45114_t
MFILFPSLKIVNGLRHFGVGLKVTRSIYRHPNTFWTITRVQARPGVTHGKVFGRLTWNGKVAEKDTEVRCPLKKQWTIVEAPNYSQSS